MELTLNVNIVSQDKIVVNGISSTIKQSHRSLGRDVSYAVCHALDMKCKTLNGTYNVNVYWPFMLRYAIMCAKKEKFSLAPTRHYQDKAASLNLPDNCYKVALFGEVIEATFEQGKLVHIVTRIPNRYNKSVDLCFAVDINMNGKTNKGTVLTVWTNNSTDNHTTLNDVSYVQPPTK